MTSIVCMVRIYIFRQTRGLFLLHMYSSLLYPCDAVLYRFTVSPYCHAAYALKKKNHL